VDPDPDPAFQVNPDTGFWWRKTGAYIYFLHLFFWSKIAIYLSQGLLKECPSYRRSLQPSKEIIQQLKTWNFLIFSYVCVSFLPSWILVRIWFANPDPDTDPGTPLNPDPDLQQWKFRTVMRDFFPSFGDGGGGPGGGWEERMNLRVMRCKVVGRQEKVLCFSQKIVFASWKIKYKVR
jgi:hypothetical protein